jgi:hypothetical protein
LAKVRDHVEEAEAEMFLRAADVAHSTNGDDESQALHSAAARLSWFKETA